MSDRAEPLKRILRRHTLGTALVPLLVVEVSLVLVYLGLGQELASRWRAEVMDGLRANLEEVVDSRGEQLGLRLTEIEQKTDLLRTQSELLLGGELLSAAPAQPELFAVGTGGALYQIDNDRGASVFYSATTPIGPRELAKIAATEPLDPLFARSVDSDPQVVAAYLNTHDDLNRYYPFIERAADQFPPDMQMEDFAFYYAADAEHNPERGVVWTEAYLDPAGAGWMVSSVAPVYVGDALEGVIGLDVTIPALADAVLELDLPYDAPALLVSESGSLLGLNHAAARRFDAPTDILEGAPQGIESAERTLEEEAPLNQLLGDASEELLGRLRSDTSRFHELSLRGESFFLVHTESHGSGWHIAVLVEKEQVLAPVQAIEDRSEQVALLIIGAVALFYLLFFTAIYRRTQRLASHVAEPLAQLTSATETPLSGEQPSTPGLPQGASSIAEIEKLRSSFASMVESVQRHRAHIEAMNRDLEAKVREEVDRNRMKDHLLLEQSRLASLGEMVASIAHQWRQPLTSLQYVLDDLRLSLEMGDDLTADELEARLGDCDQLIQHLSGTINDFRAIYSGPGDHQTTELGTVLGRSLAIADGAMKASGLSVETEIEPSLEGRTIPGGIELCHITLNLLSNARAILVERKVENPRVVLRARRNGQGIVVEVEDNGGGVDPELVPTLFEPFVTSREEGTGLGLYMSRRLIEDCLGGTIELKRGSKGAVFVLSVPSDRGTPRAMGSQRPEGRVGSAPAPG